jgi:hypothetical protein
MKTRKIKLRKKNCELNRFVAIEKIGKIAHRSAHKCRENAIKMYAKEENNNIIFYKQEYNTEENKTTYNYTYNVYSCCVAERERK